MPEGFGLPPTNAQPATAGPQQVGQIWAPGMPTQRPAMPPARTPQSPQAPRAPKATPESQLPFRRVYYKTLRKGSLISCQYTFWKHDANPLIVVTDVGIGPQVGLPEGVPGIRGVNLHYLTFNYVRSVLQQYCGKQHFGYKFIMHDPYIVNAFRTYKRMGLRKVQMLDCDVINQELQTRRSLNPQEIKEIRKQIRQQLRQRVNPNAAELAKQYTGMIGTSQDFENQAAQPDGRRIFRPSAPAPVQGTIPGQPASIPGRPASG